MKSQKASFRRIAIVVLLLAAQTACSKPPPDPIVDGAPLSRWVKRYKFDSGGIASVGETEREDERARSAIRRAGTNAIPLLLDYLERQDNVISGNYKGLTGKITSYHYNHWGENGFHALGELAVPALPRLRKIAALNSWPRSERAKSAIAAIEQASKAGSNSSGR